MGRRKQSRPNRSGGAKPKDDLSSAELGVSEVRGEGADESVKPLIVEVDRELSWGSDEGHRDLSEVVLTGLELSERLSCSEEFIRESNWKLRISVENVGEFQNRSKLWHWPVLSSGSVRLEFVVDSANEDGVVESVMLSGSFDGPDEAVTGLVHLVSLKLVTLRPVLGAEITEGVSSVRVRVEILKSTFDACESLLDCRRQVWKNSMMNVMAWLRPEATTLEARYGVNEPVQLKNELVRNEETPSKIHARFDASGFYEAIKPSKKERMLEEELPDLLPELRPYQRRAAYWMVQRETGKQSIEGEDINFLTPFCVPVEFIESSLVMFYNPFSGSVSLNPEYSSSQHVLGGILADEMGLGKTVELLACIFCNRNSSREVFSASNIIKVTEEQKSSLRRVKKERIECVCGSVTESPRYEGLWVQCDVCAAWQHGDCVNYKPRRKRQKSGDCKLSRNSSMGAYKRSTANNVDVDGDFICQLCSELIQATHSPIPTGATLIVCPGPILPQWLSEINRHTRTGSLKICVYDGVRDDSTSKASITDINELIRADIVLTTYDVLKADLSHDSDRHEGDRRLLRFHKRYPVVPTMLTRVYWWRICLDEAQMVESSTGHATEMALRLHGKHRWCITGTPIQRRLDDLHGLIRFIRATPFDIPRWWVEVIRDPYENGAEGCMRFTHKFFKEIMWRSSKAHVADELQLPPQEEHLSWLSFSAIEEHFYQRQHDTCVGYAREIVDSFRNTVPRKAHETSPGDDLNDPFITHTEAAKLLNSLLKLRQACCHPQVGVSGLRSLQQSPMTMDEILQVLIGKTKVEGEEALRTLVSALNGLAGIAIIRHDMHQAVAFYEESLAITKEHLEDFRLDPLMNLHVHHNLAEMYRESVPSLEHVQEKRERHVSESASSVEFDSVENGNRYKRSEVIQDEVPIPLKLITRNLEVECEKVIQKFLSVFSSKLSTAQQDFRNLYSQVHESLRRKDAKAHAGWWLDALHSIEGTSDSSKDLMKKIDDALSSGIKKSRSSRIISCFRSITSLKYYIQTSWDSLVMSRQSLMDRITQINETMKKPRDEDIERVRCCSNCHFNGTGVLCIHCELDELFQAYEARLFRMNENGGGVIMSAEEVLDFQKKKTALNRFYWSLGQPKTASSSIDNEDTRRNIGEKVVVSKSPSDLEIILVIIKNCSKAHLGREDLLAAAHHLALLENMRKEYPHARSLAIAQAQVLHAYDEIKMATSRLRLRKSEDDNSVDALSIEQLDEACVQNTHAKILALSSLLRIKGQLRYLKGLALSKRKMQSESTENTSARNELGNSLASSTEKKSECIIEVDEETCPICQENLSNRKMVFQCGHITCCKCFFAISDMRLRHGTQAKWVMCPTCRQHTDEGNIAYVDDGKMRPCNLATLISYKECETSEDSIGIQGSYGTKIEAITRRILWIKTSDPKAKVLVFSSWNDVLDVLQHSLTSNNISYVRMRGGRKAHSAICQFRGETSASGEISKFIQVMLILIQHGANGLNLLEAQHVVLVEPLLNPAVEAQAISRVHRIGQRSKTLVHRFAVKGTVEEGILKLSRSRNSSSSCISGNTKNQDQPVLTLKDVESLFAIVPPKSSDTESTSSKGSLMHLPPSVAAVMAAEQRLQEHTT
ncbi:unnamed protein product [Rhodiola kirilowii]